MVNSVFCRIDGGGNIDTLKLNGNDLILDLTNISNARIQDIEKINISGSGDNTLIVNLNDVLDASTSTNILKVVSLPAPALKTSIPPLPVRMSLPIPATNISSSLAPVRALSFSSPK
jgi:hypothetical protein